MDRTNFLKNMPEAKSIINFITNRHRKGLLNVVKFIGLSGTGKSYASLRLAELLSTELHGENKITIFNTVDNLLDLIRFIRNVKVAGEIVIIEEAEVLFPARRAMSGDNVDAIKIFDTMRKKKMIVILNYPLNKSIDSHIDALCNLQLETLSLNKSLGVCTVKPMILQTNPASGKTYFHRLRNSDGGEVHRSHLLKPTDQLCSDYEKKKDGFIETLHQQLEAKQLKKIEKDMPKEVRQLTERQMKIIQLIKDGASSQEEIAQKIGISQSAVSENFRWIKSKGHELPPFQNPARVFSNIMVKRDILLPPPTS